MKFQLNRRPSWMALWITIFSAAASFAHGEKYFKRISTFLVCEQFDENCDTDLETVAETLWYYTNGDKTSLVYSDAEQEGLGLVDITDPSNPVADGFIPLEGGPTTVRVIGDYAVVGVDTSEDYVNVSGDLVVVDLTDNTIVREIPLPGQPDAVDVSKPGSDDLYIAVAIENERDEDLNDGELPQLPAGLLTIVDVPDVSDPSTWTSRDVDLTGLDGCRFKRDPEPEYVAINGDNTLVVVTLQENNCNVVVELSSGDIVSSTSAGKVVLDNIDLTEEDVVDQSDTDADGFFREPDGATWIGDTDYFATANEGDLEGGSRGFSIFDKMGNLVYDSGNSMELEVARIGHYPENRSENKGNEPENVFYAEAKKEKYLFVGSERSSLVFVYEVSDPTAPEFRQTLPVGIAPEGLAFVPEMDLLVVASEKDSREDYRASISIFELGHSKTPEYPTLVSEPREGASKSGPFIPFAALSGLAGVFKKDDNNCLVAVEDSSYKKSRVLTIDAKSFPAVITQENRIMDTDGVLAACLDGDIDDYINDDMTVNIDSEGIADAGKGEFWVVSEGEGTESPNLLLKLTSDFVISSCVMLDDSFPTPGDDGFSGVAMDKKNVVVSIGTAWDGEANPRIAVYNTATMTWKYAFYPLDEPASQNGGSVSISDIAPAGPKGKFFVLEVDDQGSADAAIKKIYRLDLGDYSFADGSTLEKKLYRDLIPDFLAKNGQVPSSIQGLAVSQRNGKVWVNNDVDVGEHQLINVATLPRKNSKKGKNDKGMKMEKKSDKKSDKKAKRA